jgi:hypothetical protein
MVTRVIRLATKEALAKIGPHFVKEYRHPCNKTIKVKLKQQKKANQPQSVSKHG